MSCKVKTPERLVVKACLDYLALNGIKAWRTNSGAAMLPGRGGKLQPVRFGKKGLPDICGFLPGGRALFVECKGTGGKLSEEQANFLRVAHHSGCFAVVVYSVDELDKAIRAEWKAA